MRVFAIYFLILFLSFFYSCSRENQKNEIIDNTSKNEVKRDRTKYGDVVIEGSISDANNLIPILANDLTSHTIASMVYNGLVKYDKDLNIVGDLAQKWDVSTDNKVITFYLRKDVKWHDGTAFNADDVIFTYKTIINDSTPTPYDGDFRKIANVEKIDNYTIKVLYNTPYAPALASWSMSILPKHLLEGNDITKSFLQRAPIGTGPFKFEDWASGSAIKLKANNNYFAKGPYLDGYMLKIIPDSTSMFLELLKSRIDLMELTPIQYVKQTDDSKFSNNYNKYTYLSDTYTFVGYNLKNELFNDKRVRHALSPCTFAAIIKSLSFIDSVSARINLVTPIHPVKPITTITFVTDGSKKAITDNTRKNTGKQSIMSTNLIITASTKPLKYPETSPNIVPITMEIKTAIKLTNNETLPPYKTLVRTSLPNSSVPNKCSLDGAIKISFIFISVGLYLLNTGANIDRKINRNIIKRLRYKNIYFLETYITL